MNTRILIALALISVFILPAIAPIMTTAKAETIPVKVSASYVNYNIVRLEITSPADKPPVVQATIYDEYGNVAYQTNTKPVTLVAGYIGANTWVVYIALNKTFDKQVFGAATFSKPSDDVEFVTSAANFTMNDLDPTGQGLLYIYYGADLAAGSVELYKNYIAVDGYLVSQIINAGAANTNYTGASLKNAWPIVNAFDDNKVGLGYTIEVKVETEAGSNTVDIAVGPSPVSVETTSYLNMAPEKTVEAEISDPTLIVDPTATAELTNVTSMVSLQTNSTTQATIKFMSKAMKAAILEASNDATSSLNLVIELGNNSNAAWLEAKLNTPAATLHATVYLHAYLNMTYYNTSGKEVFTLPTKIPITAVLNNTVRNIVIFNMTKLNLTGKAALNVTLCCVEATIVPYDITTLVNAQRIDGTNANYTADLLSAAKVDSRFADLSTVLANYTIAMNYASEDFAVVKYVDSENGMLVFYISMPGRGAIPSFIELQNKVSATTNIPVTITIDDYAALASSLPVEDQIVGYIKLTNAELSIAESTAQISKAITIQLNDTDAPGKVYAKLCVFDAYGNKLYTTYVSLKATTEGQLSGKVYVYLSSRNSFGYDPYTRKLYVTGDAALIVVKYFDPYGQTGKPITVKAAVPVEFWPTSVNVTTTQAAPEQVVDLVIKSDNFNQYSTVEKLYADIMNGYVLIKYGGSAGTPVGNITIKWYQYNPTTRTYTETTLTQAQLQNLMPVRSLLETTKNSGEYMLPLYLSTLGLHNGDKLEITYTDLLTGAKTTLEITITTYLGQIKLLTYDIKSGSNVPVDSIPLALAYGANESKTYVVVVKDLDANKDASKIENVTANIYLLLNNNTEAPLNGSPAALFETDYNSGVFVTGLGIKYYESKGVWYANITLGKNFTIIRADKLVYAKLIIEYYDQSAAKTVKLEVPFRPPTTAKLTVTPATAASIDTNVTITFSDEDLDLTPGAGNDYLPPGFTIFVQGCANAKPIFINGKGLINGTKLTFEEVEPGVFSVTMKAGTLLAITGCKIGEQAQLIYVDPAAAGSVMNNLRSETVTATFAMTAHNAELYVTPTKVSPFGIINITIEDQDLVGVDPATVAANLMLASSKGSWYGSDLLGASLQVMSHEDGKFSFQLRLGTNLVGYNDLLYVVYVDKQTATGSPLVLKKVVNVVSETGKFISPVNMSEVKEGGLLNITIEDFDRNTRYNAYDPITVYVWSDAAPLRKPVTLAETGPDTGVFSTVIKISDNPLDIGKPNVVFAPTGSTVYILYVDPHGSNGEANVTVLEEVKVVKAVVTPFPAKIEKEEISIINVLTGQKLTKIPANKVGVAISVPVHNNGTEPITTAYVIVTIYKNGVPVGVAVGTASNIPAGQTVYVPVVLPPLPAGTYTAKVLILSDLTTLKPLTKTPIEITLTVE